MAWHPPLPPVCREPGCGTFQQTRSDGVGLGYCAEHRAARLRSHPIGTVTPGPRGKANSEAASNNEGCITRSSQVDASMYVDR